MPDWRNAEDYAYCKDLTLHNWAWEFLRRNPDYRQGWRELPSGDPSAEELLERRKALGAAFGLGIAEDPSLDVFKSDVFWMEGAGVKMLWRWDAVPEDEAQEVPWPGSPHSCALLFNLRVSIDAQIQHARRLLMSFQEATAHLAHVPPPEPKARPQPDKFTGYIRALDAREAGASQKTIGKALFGDSKEPRDKARYALKTADALVQGGYRDLLHRPDL